MRSAVPELQSKVSLAVGTVYWIAYKVAVREAFGCRFFTLQRPGFDKSNLRRSVVMHTQATQHGSMRRQRRQCQDLATELEAVQRAPMYAVELCLVRALRDCCVSSLLLNIGTYTHVRYFALCDATAEKPALTRLAENAEQEDDD